MGTAFVLIIVACLSLSEYVGALKIFIDGVHGKDNPDCGGLPSHPCLTLSHVSENFNETSCIEINILSQVLNLTVAVNFTDITNLTITGSGILHCNESNSGLAFIRVTDLFIKSLTIENCGALRPSTSILYKSLPVAVYLLNCTNVFIHSVQILSSNGTGLSLYDTNGIVDIIDSNFTNNTVIKRSEAGGGGIHIEFTTCSSETVPSFNNDIDQNSNSQYCIYNCTFIGNSAHSTQENYMYVPQSLEPVPRLGKGGGLYISVGSQATNNSFFIEHATFESNNASFLAGGMIAEFLNSVVGNVVLLRDIHFINNTCYTVTEFSGGGGLVVAFMFYSGNIIEDHHPHSNSFECINCTFIGNRAEMGGGASIFVTKTTNKSSLSNISFTNCTWKENKSPMGAGVFITPALWDYSREGFLPIPVFTDCTFESNSAIQTLTQSTNESIGVKVESVGFAAIYITQLTVMFKGNSNFTQNQGSAVHLSSGVMHFKEFSNVRFVGNTGHNGGAIAMYGPAMIQIENSSSFLFEKNRATMNGGGIYFSFIGNTEPAYHNCFISSTNFSPVDSTFTFSDNSAKASGDSIYTTTFRSCSLQCSQVHQDPRDIMQCIANFSYDEASLSTRAEKFTLLNQEPVTLIPGFEHILNLSAYDEYNTNLTGVIYEASVNNRGLSIDQAFLQVSNNAIKIKGDSGVSGKLQLSTVDRIISFDVKLAVCQPGYSMDSNISICECSASNYLGLEGCDPNVYIKHGFWMGYCSQNSTKLCTSYCPDGYCTYHYWNGIKQSYKLGHDPEMLNKDICGPTRRGRICGQCAPNLSVHFNSAKYVCRKEDMCHWGWLFYILTFIVPNTIQFVVVIVFNFSFTMGTANSIVLYYQIIGMFSIYQNELIPISSTVNFFQNIVAFLYDSLNQHFFSFEVLSYCVWKGATSMGVTLLDYFTIGYELVLFLVTVYLTRLTCVQKKIFFRFNRRTSVLIQGLSTFIILCYSHALKISFHILHSSSLNTADSVYGDRVAFNAGYMNYFGREHAPYAAFAIFVLVFMIVLPPMVLLVYPLVFKLFDFCKMSDTKLAHLMWRAMPIHFLDAFQSSYKDKYRFFAGLYLLYRVLFAACFIATGSWSNFYCTAQVLLTAISCVHGVIQPYKLRKHNIVEQLLFANLCLVNAISLLCYLLSQVDRKGFNSVIGTLGIFQVVIILLPLLVLIISYLTKWIMIRRRRREYKVLPDLRSKTDTDS